MKFMVGAMESDFRIWCGELKMCSFGMIVWIQENPESPWNRMTPRGQESPMRRF
jgi:hypothetical protein